MDGVILDSTAYPHILERVVAFAQYELLMRLRLVNRALHDTANAALFAHVAVSRPNEGQHSNPDLGMGWISESRLPVTLLSATGGRLPVPPLPNDKVSISLPKHRGWSHTRTLDLKTNARGLLDADLPALETVRRVTWSEDAPSAHTYVDAHPVPPLHDGDLFIDFVSEETRRHVIVVLYDPDWRGLKSDSDMTLDFCQEDVHGVFIFRACSGSGPSHTTAANGADAEDDEVEEHGWTEDYGMDEDDDDSGDDGLDEDDELEEDITDDDMSDGSGHGITREQGKTFLWNYLWIAADRLHKTYTFVGLEDVPPDVLALEFDLDVADVTRRSRGPRDEWARFIAKHALDAIQAIPPDEDPERQMDKRTVEEVVEVLTKEEYRARVGQEAWTRESLRDVQW